MAAHAGQLAQEQPGPHVRVRREANLVGEYDNGTAQGLGSTEYIWLPVEGGNAIPVGIYRNGKFYQVHTDHLGTPRLVTDSANAPVWQWPYSAFGNNRTTGVLSATTTSSGQVTLRATKAPVAVNLRFPGQYFDEESNLSYNYFRSYRAGDGRYTQADPIGLAGGMNRMTYADNNPLLMIDPWGLMGGSGSGAAHRNPAPVVSGFGCIGILCASGSTQDSGAQFSAELTFGGGIEICDAPKPTPDPQTCSRNIGDMYGDGSKPQGQYPGLPVPKRFGGAFIGPSMKADGRVCLRFGPHVSLPFPSLDLGGLK